MIGFLKGEIIDVDEKAVILNVGGVGYLIQITDSSKFKVHSSTLDELFIHTHVREDEISLYGFESKRALKVFELLISVSGVGPKMAMNVLRKGSAEQIQQAVANADVSFFTAVSGIGKKNGQRIIVDLKSKLGSLQDLDLGSDSDLRDDLVQALVSMGFDQKTVVDVLRDIARDLPESHRLKLALKMLSNK